ncbi:MAG: selenide, water dikinase SelD [Bradymonadales bacterium]|nr:selenide, water dikinase SelD [Bradymonadales bacterium]
MNTTQDFIYLDYNATTPVDPRVAQAMRPYLTGFFGNPSSTHRMGREAKKAVESARSQVAACLGAEAEEIIFTSGGTESNNLAIRGVVAALGGGHVITSAIEHPAILEVVKALQSEGQIRLTILGVDATGLVDPADVQRALRPDTVLVTVMLANNEVGTIEPIREIARICQERGVLVHTDAAQAIGKIPVDMTELGVDLLSVAGHKLYAPKGIGALYVKRGTPIQPLMRGAGHERGMRAGTENILEQVGLGAACALVHADVEKEAARLRTLRDRLSRLLDDGFVGLVHHGHPERRLPNTLSIAFPGLDAGLLLTRLGDELGASAGAACHADSVDPSHVLTAMGVDPATSMSTVRLSVGRFTTEAEVEEGARRILDVVRELAGDHPLVSPVSTGAAIRLTQFSHGLGCACKLQPQVLEEVLKAIPRITRQEVVVGTETADDACAWRLGDGRLLVQTLDFFAPVVDSPRLFGAIAAANALSDVYAMGAEPLFALNIVGFPVMTLPVSVLEEILAGANEVAEEAGIPILGGHSIDDNEPKYGLVVTGVVDEARLWRNIGARPGDLLLLTKPLGTGLWATAAKHGVAEEAGWQVVQGGMRQLNRPAAEILRPAEPHAVTDVTGFGLLGHLHEMLAGSGVNAELWLDAVPIIEGTRRLVAMGEVPGGTRSNLAHARSWTTFDQAIDEPFRVILADAQTSGGLLAAVDPAQVEQVVANLVQAHLTAAVIGTVTGQGEGRIDVRVGRA